MAEQPQFVGFDRSGKDRTAYALAKMVENGARLRERGHHEGEKIRCAYRAAAREETGETVMAWSPDGSRIAVKMGQISGTRARGWWFNADDGTVTDLGTFPTNGMRTFRPPQARQVLVLDDADRSLPPPGAGVYAGTANRASRPRSSR